MIGCSLCKALAPLVRKHRLEGVEKDVTIAELRLRVSQLENEAGVLRRHIERTSPSLRDRVRSSR